MSTGLKTFRASALAVTALVAVTIALLLGVGSNIRGQVRDIGVANAAFTSGMDTLSHAIGRLSGALGYGGYIHHYKNFVIRRDPALLKVAAAKRREADEALETIATYFDDAEGRALVERIRVTLDIYDARMDVAADYSTLLSVQEMDAMVRTSDDAALAALDQLEARRRHVVESGLAAAETAIADTQRAVRSGAVVFVLIAALLGLVVALTRRNAGAMERLVAAERGLREATKAAQAADEAKTAFLTTISHELRTPLNGVLGMLQLLERDALPAPALARVAVGRESAEFLLALINQLIDMGRIEAGAKPLVREPFRPGDLLSGLETLFAGLAARKGVGFSVSFEDGVGPGTGTGTGTGRLMGAPTEIKQVLFNLIGNAIKFTEKGEVRVEATLSRDAESAPRLRVAVRDDGPGLAPADRARIFERFGQTEGGRRKGGAGLGLSITAKLVEMMRGRITLESALGAGSVFAVELPLEDCAEAPPETEAAPVARSAPLSVLAADDNEVNRMVIEAALRAEGHSVRLAADGAEAVAAVADDPEAFDIVLLDCQMPVMDGLEATRRIRALGGAAARTPVIALTANATEARRAECLAAGMQGVVTKPFRLDDLYAALAAGLRAAA